MMGPPDNRISSSTIRQTLNKILMSPIEERSLNQPLPEQLDNLTGIFPNQISPTLHPSFSTRHRAIQPQMRHQTPSVSNLPMHPEVSEKIDNLHNLFKYNKKSILPKEHESNLPFKKSRYSLNNLIDFTFCYKFNSDINSLLYQSSSNQILDP